jgi:arylformamidase
MTGSRAKIGIMLLAASAMVVAGSALAQRAQFPPECREQIVSLCRGAQGGIRQCMMTALPKLSDSCRKAISDRAAARAPQIPGLAEYSFGADPLQKLDLLKPTGGGRAPILLFLHGGGWSIGDKRQAEGAKPTHFTANGWAFASANYRLVPQATVEQQAADVAAAIAWLRAHAAEQGLDPDHIVLMGHSAGAHLAALVGTDPRYLAAAAVPLKAIAGVVLLDGAGYDVPLQIKSPGNLVRPMYEAAFGTDPVRQRALSPSFQTAAPNVARWLILPVATRADSLAQSKALAAGLTRAGSRADVMPVPDSSHAKLNHQLGTDGDFATGKVDRFLAALR